MFRLAGFLVVAWGSIIVGGCAAYVGTNEAHKVKEPDFEYGFIAYHIHTEIHPNESNEKFPMVQLVISKSKALGSLFGGINSFQRRKSDLKVFFAKPGQYDPPRFLLGLDTRLNHDSKLNEFEVVQGEVTYIGDYRFDFYKGGWFREGFDVEIWNNILQRRSEIEKYIEELPIAKRTGYEIRTPDMGGNFNY